MYGSSWLNSKSMKRTSSTFFPLVLGVNPVEVAPQPFIRILGYQTIEVFDVTTGFKFSFDIDGGVNSLSGGCITSYDSSGQWGYIRGSEVNATIIFGPNETKTNQVYLTTDPADSGGRTYKFVFNIFAEGKPTIEKLAGAPIAGELQVYVIDHPIVPK